MLRPVLAGVWLMQKHTVPPTEFSKLVDEILPIELKDSVEELLSVKMKSKEKKKGTRMSQIDSFVEAKLNELMALPVIDEAQDNYEKLDKIFLEIVRQR